MNRKLLKVFKLFCKDAPSEKTRLNGIQARHGHILRGLPPTKARSLRQRLDAEKQRDPSLALKVDIGLPLENRRPKRDWLLEYKKSQSNSESERLARHRELFIDLDKAHHIWHETDGPSQTKTIAEHYGIFRDLFGNAYFHPTVSLDIRYPTSQGATVRVYRGNVIKPKEADETPTVAYAAKENTLWTLLMTTPDGNMENTEHEYCHWFVGNIPGKAMAEGEEIIDYAKPLPPRGVGYFRYIFVLYKQEKELRYDQYKRTRPCSNLSERDWNTLEFYRTFQDYLTPAGLAFFQADWDPSVKEFYHNALGTREPIFAYDFPKPYVRRQEWFPLKRPFNTYLDRYRDPRDVMKRYLSKKLANVDPLKKPDPPLKFPNAHPYRDGDPSWLRVETKKDRLGWGRINNL